MTDEKCKEKKNRTKKKTLVELFPLPSLLRLPELCPSVEKIFYRNSAFLLSDSNNRNKKIIAGQTNSNMKLPKCWYTDDWVDFPCRAVGDLKQVRFNP